MPKSRPSTEVTPLPTGPSASNHTAKADKMANVARASAIRSARWASKMPGSGSATLERDVDVPFRAEVFD